MIKLSTRIITNKNNHNDPLKTALRFPSQSVSADVWLLLPSMQKIQVLTIFFFFFLLSIITRFIKWKRITRKRKETEEKHGKETYLKYV